MGTHDPGDRPLYQRSPLIIEHPSWCWDQRCTVTSMGARGRHVSEHFGLYLDAFYTEARLEQCPESSARPRLVVDTRSHSGASVPAVYPIDQARSHVAQLQQLLLLVVEQPADCGREAVQ